MTKEQKIAFNMQPIINKDFIELSSQELIQLVKDAKTHYFYYKKDGVNVAYGRENNNSNGVFDLEMVACKVLTDYGHEVYLLPENYAADMNKSKKIHGDTITDDRTLELKHTAKNVQDNYRKGEGAPYKTDCKSGDRSRDRIHGLFFQDRTLRKGRFQKGHGYPYKAA